MNTPAPAIIRSGTCCAIDEPMPGEDPRAGIDLALEHAEQTDLPLAVLSWFEQLGPPYRPLILPGFAPPSDSPAPRTVAQPALPAAALTGSALPRLGGDTPVNIVRTAWPATLTNALPASVGVDRVASRQSLVQNLLSGMPAPAATANQSTKGKALPCLPPSLPRCQCPVPRLWPAVRRQTPECQRPRPLPGQTLSLTMRRTLLTLPKPSRLARVPRPCRCSSIVSSQAPASSTLGRGHPQRATCGLTFPQPVKPCPPLLSLR